MKGSDSDFLFLEYNSYHTIFTKKKKILISSATKQVLENDA